METIYVAGHKSPDLDSVMGSISYAYLKQAVDSGKTYQPVVAGDLNPETKYIIEKYQLDTPPLLESVAGKSVILVDHNEEYQAIDGIKEAKILEIIDHHKMAFSYSDPIKIIIDPIGSSCSVIAKMFRAENIEIPKNLAAGMLAAVLTDTVITKSPTTTPEDLTIIQELAEIAGISDWKTYGMEIFKVRSSISDLDDEDIITSDYKDFDIGGHKFGIGQIETVDIDDFSDRKLGLLEELENRRQHNDYHSVVLFITDIIKEESLFLIASEQASEIAQAFDKQLEGNSFVAPVLSRKKEVVPKLIHQFS